jgi:rod shape determining protein RodA
MQALAIVFYPYLFFRNQTLVARSSIVFYYCFISRRTAFWYVWTGFVTIALFVLTLVLEPQYVILLALLVILMFILNQD